MKIKAELLKIKDVKAFYEAFSKIKNFKVNHRINFYEQKEISEWTKDRRNNLLCVIKNNNKIIGFCFCKIFSYHWAFVDNFYILPEHRRKKMGTILQEFLMNKLKEKSITYVSRIVNVKNLSSQKFLKNKNYKSSGKFIWYDKFIN